MSSRPSTEFQSLLDGLLTKDASRRISWSALIIHPFWQDALQHLTHCESEASSDVRQSLRQTAANFTTTLTGDSSRPTIAVLETTTQTADTGLCDATLAHATDDARPGKPWQLLVVSAQITLC